MILGKRLLLAACPLLIAASGAFAEISNETLPSSKKIMSAPSVSLGYVILYVKDVSASLVFYENAFGLTRRFLHEEGGKGYGELETGAARLGFASFSLVDEHLKGQAESSGSRPPSGSEIALVTTDVPALFARAVKAGATVVGEPATKPWGQTVAYLRDNGGHLVELCTPLP